MENFASVDDLWNAGMELYKKVIAFSNEPIKYKGCVSTEDLIKIENLITSIIPDVLDFWVWMSEQKDMEYIIDESGAINSRLLKEDHSSYLLEHSEEVFNNFANNMQAEEKAYEKSHLLIGEVEEEEEEEEEESVPPPF